MDCIRQMAYAIISRIVKLFKDPEIPIMDPVSGDSVINNSLIKVLRLEANQDFTKTLFRFSQETIIRFTLGPSLFGQKPRLYTNYPEDNINFVRNKYRHHKWNVNSEDKSFYFDLKLVLPGSFRYFLVSEEDEDELDCSGYLLVEPVLEVGSSGQVISLDSIVCHTILSKLLGTFDKWHGRLLVSSKCGYNMLHFTPIQELGGSQSAYSIKNQLRINPKFSYNQEHPEHSFEHVSNLVEYMRKDWSMLSITDIVLNHTANETPWIFEHPECCYNMKNSPHLRPAYLLDRMLWHFTLDIINGKWKERGLTNEITDEAHLRTIEALLWEHYVPLIRLEEFYLLGADRMAEDLKHCLIQIAQCTVYPIKTPKPVEELIVIQDHKYRRLRSRVDVNTSLNMVAWDVTRSAITKDLVEERANLLKPKAAEINLGIKAKIEEHLKAAVSNVISQIRYERLADHGPKKRYVTHQCPLVTQYFTTYGPERTLEEEEKAMYDEKFCIYFFAHNGWVMGQDPLKNFADPGSYVYLRRELIAWSDSVKLRFGEKPEDCPFLWDYMKKYVESTAQIFHGIRLDNCHSTPLHVAEYLLDCARKIRPNLYVIAELFTSSEEIDNIFVNRLGINSLIRESLAASDSHELGRFIHRYGGEPVGAFEKLKLTPIIPSMAHAIMFDMTHDNPCPIEKRSIFDYLASAGMVAMSASAIGSSRGYDELIPHHIHVVNEWRPWAFWSDSGGHEHVSYDDGILYAKKTFNDLHKKLANEGYSEIFVDQVNFDVVAITRHNPVNHKSVILVARTCFCKTNTPWETGYIKPLHVAGHFNEILFEAALSGDYEEFSQANNYINGLKNMKAEIKHNVKISESSMVKIDSTEGNNIIEFVKFTPGSVICFDVSLEANHTKALKVLHETVGKKDELTKVFESLTFDDLNFILFRTEQEERDEISGGVYNVPNFSAFTYCGLAGLMFYWKDIRTKNDLGHPICNNLRDGLWLPDYIANRLSKRKSTVPLSNWLKNSFNALRAIPTYLRPRYFDDIVTATYSLSLKRCWQLLSDIVSHPTNFSRLLLNGSFALVGFNPTSPLPPLSDDISSPQPPSILLGGIPRPKAPTIAAGFPHFASGFMRNWGRDTFIALRGLLLVSGRFDEARYIILGFAGVLRHGLIPNLLDKATNARYNCRDAVWWWLQSIKDYCTMVPGGLAILQEPVKRIFPTDDSSALLSEANIQPLHHVMQEALTKHFEGVTFRERNAGPGLDAHMTDQGFNVTIGVNKVTGFVYGGNEWNCGTWMDKMGSSDKAGIRGKPATPRDGSAVELVGLCRSVVSWLAKLWELGKWSYEGVSSLGATWTWQEWSDKIDANFESSFWVSPDDTNSLINRREIYKDSVGATHAWQDFQLRPNFLVAMIVAPEMFQLVRAQKALEIVEEVLVGPLGVKTLDPSDWNYRGDYNNSDDSVDPKVAHGFNYHQGPEWLWLMGYYLRALHKFSGNKCDTSVKILRKLSEHYKLIETNPWGGLPELTNSDGKICSDSCQTQAWTIGCLLEVLYDISEIE